MFGKNVMSAESDKIRHSEYNLKNREKIKARKAAYYQANKEHEKARQADYREKNREIKRARDFAYCLKNKEKRNALSKQYLKDNPEVGRRRNRIRRARLKNVLILPYKEDAVISLYGDNCYICKGKIDVTLPRRIGKIGWQKSLHIDHVIPISKGGSDTLENVRPSHAECNLHKHAKVG